MYILAWLCISAGAGDFSISVQVFCIQTLTWSPMDNKSILSDSLRFAHSTQWTPHTDSSQRHAQETDMFVELK